MAEIEVALPDVLARVAQGELAPQAAPWRRRWPRRAARAWLTRPGLGFEDLEEEDRKGRLAAMLADGLAAPPML